MPTDYTTTNTTPAAPGAPGLVEVPWFQRPPTDWGQEMAAHPSPETPVAAGSAVPRPTLGLVFPR